MPRILEGGLPHTVLVTVGTTATLLAPSRTKQGQGRSVLIIQQAGSTDVRIGGADVVASGAAGTTFLQAGQGDAVGLLLNALPSPQTSPPTAPTNLSIASSGEAIYGIVASGTSTVIVYEEF